MRDGKITEIRMGCDRSGGTRIFVWESIGTHIYTLMVTVTIQVANYPLGAIMGFNIALGHFNTIIGAVRIEPWKATFVCLTKQLSANTS